MSIIQEALRRKAEERDGPPQDPTQWPAKPSSHPAPGRKKTAYWGGIATLVLAGIAILVLAAAVRTGIQLWSGREPARIETDSGPAAPSGYPAVTAEAVPDRAPEKQPDEVAGVSAPTPGPDLPDPELPVEDVASEPEPPALSDLSEPAATPESVSPEPEPADPPAAASPPPWPRITLAGIMSTRAGARGTALFRGAPPSGVGEGEAYRGIQVVRIRPDSVTVEYQGEQRTLRVGQSTRDDY